METDATVTGPKRATVDTLQILDDGRLRTLDQTTELGVFGADPAGLGKPQSMVTPHG